MSKLYRDGVDIHYRVRDESGQIVGLIDKTMVESGDEDAAVYVTLPCGHKTRFWATYFTDDQYIEAAIRIK